MAVSTCNLSQKISIINYENIDEKLKPSENQITFRYVKPETAIEKGMAGPGLLAYIVSSKFADYLPLYRQTQT